MQRPYLHAAAAQTTCGCLIRRPWSYPRSQLTTSLRLFSTRSPRFFPPWRSPGWRRGPGAPTPELAISCPRPPSGPARPRDGAEKETRCPTTTLTGARTMWELVARRADATPDQPDADRRGRRDPHLRRVPRPGRAGGRRAVRRSGSAPARSSRGNSRPGSTPWCSPSPCPGSGRSRTRSSTSTASGRWGSPCARPARPSWSSPGRGGTSTLRPLRSAPSPTPPRGRRSWSSTTGCPRGTRPPCPPPPKGRRRTTPPSAGSTTPRARRLTPRGSSTPTRRSSPAGGAWRRPSRCRRTTSAPSPSPSRTSPGPTTW
jgi:hypothetical protein